MRKWFWIKQAARKPRNSSSPGAVCNQTYTSSRNSYHMILKKCSRAVFVLIIVAANSIASSVWTAGLLDWADLNIVQNSHHDHDHRRNDQIPWIRIKSLFDTQTDRHLILLAPQVSREFARPLIAFEHLSLYMSRCTVIRTFEVFFLKKVLWGPRRPNIRNFCYNYPWPTIFWGPHFFGPPRPLLYV